MMRSAALLRRIALLALGVFFVAAGALHFLRTEMYVRTIPPWLPAPLDLVYVSGVFEILGGLGVLIPASRKLAGGGLIVLLIAVFPANLQMATHASDYADIASPLLLWLRLPLQALLIYWVRQVCFPRR